MDSYIFMGVLAIILIVIGILNMKGNINSLHSYHRNRVSEADRVPFGRMVGLGTIIVGISLLLNAACAFALEKTGTSTFSIAGTVILVIGLVVGIGLNFYAMIKYNKGIF